MYSVLILEDKKIQRNAIELILKKKYPEWNVSCAASYHDAVSLLDTDNYDLFLLDIILSDEENALSGLDFGLMIRDHPQYKNTPIIFLTILTDEIYPAVQKLHCYSYLTKPYSENDLLEALAHFTSSHPSKEPMITFPYKKSVSYNLHPSQINYIEAQHKNLLIHIYGTTIISHMSLQAVITKLPPVFLRVHKSYIVNLQKITSYDRTKQTIEIDASHQIPLGRTYKKIFETIFFSSSV